MSDFLAKIPLRVAFEGTCDECGRDFYVRPQVVSVKHAEKNGFDGIDEIIESEFDGELIVMPKTVSCPHCGTAFETEEPCDD